MHYNIFSKLSVSLALIGATSLIVPANAQEHTHHEGSHSIEVHDTDHDTSSQEGHSVKEQIKETIEHHLSDSYDFTITEGVSFPLPVILYDEGLKMFMSSAFHHGESLAEVNGDYYALYHSKVYKTEANGVLWLGAIADEHRSEISEKIKEGATGLLTISSGDSVTHYMVQHASSGHHASEEDQSGVLTVSKSDKNGQINEGEYPTNTKPLDFSITKNVFMILVMAIFMFFLFKGAARAYKTGQTPRKAGRFLEPLIIYVRDEIAIPNIGKQHYKRYMSYLLTVFFFIWFMNLAGMTPLGINVTGNITITFSLALITFLITQASGNKHYWMHILWMPGVPVILKPVMAIIELIGLFVKPFSLMIRLYANMLAGHVVLMSIIGLIFVFGSWLVSPAFFGLTLVLSLLELLVAALQAYIFTMLTALYFGSAVEEHDHH